MTSLEALRLALALGLVALGFGGGCHGARTNGPASGHADSPAIATAPAPAAAPVTQSISVLASATSSAPVPAPASPSGAASSAYPAAAPIPWCASDLEALPNDVCAFIPAKEANGPRTLILFLHGVIQPGTTWQWTQQRGAARAAARHGFTMIAPRGRRGTGPKGMEDWWTWPTAAAAQKAQEDSLIGEWSAAQSEIEKRAGKPFDRVWIFGFSNGAYYATSLAMRGLLPVDGYAVFAGGSGAAHLRQSGARTKRRAPIYVGWGYKDRDRRDQEKLAKMLRDMRWPSKAHGAKGVGHTMTDAQVDEAVGFLSKRR